MDGWLSIETAKFMPHKISVYMGSLKLCSDLVLLAKKKDLGKSIGRSSLGMRLFCFYLHLFFFPAILFISTYFAQCCSILLKV